MIRTVRSLAVLALFLAAPAFGEAAPAWPTGLYSNVTSSEQTGDLGGLEVRFYEEAGRHMAELALCEGWCNDVHVAEVTRGDKGFVFGFTETFTGAEGDVPVPIRFVAWRAGNGLAYSTYQGGENIDYNGKPQRLRRTTKPFGLAVAKSGKD